MRAVVFGDSIIGADADATGGLGRALEVFLKGLGFEVAAIVGVGGSQAGHWLATAGVEEIPGRGISPGRWGRAGKGLSEEGQRRADLPTLGLLDADLYWINLATNDFHSGRTPQAFVANALDIIQILPPRSLVIWSEGNDEPDHNGVKKHALDLLAEQAPDRVLVLDTDGERQAPYVGRGLHPPIAAHEKWLEIVKPQITDHIQCGMSQSITIAVMSFILALSLGLGLPLFGKWLLTKVSP